MPQTTQCPQCRTILNLPPEAASGKRLKCPKCGTKFLSGTPESRPMNSSPGVATAGPTSGFMATTPGASRPSSHGDVDLPVSGGDLRDTFDPGMLLGESAPAAGPSRRSANADVEALFKDDEPASRRKPTGAEARRQSRRCPSCGGVVPAGMSLCQGCGLDLDTGRREVMDEVLDDDAPPPAYNAPGPPIGIALVGSAALLASGMLCILALVKLEGMGAIALGIVALFAVLASVQFLRGKSAKPLLAALIIGAGIDIVGLIVMPALEADRVSAEQTGIAAVSEDDEVRIKPIDEQIDYRRITLGLAILGIDALVLIYLSTGGVRRHFEAPRPGSPLYIP